MDYYKENIIQLIGLYCDKSLLWNLEHSVHNDGNKKNDAWEYISIILGYDKNYVEKKNKKFNYTILLRTKRITKSGDGTTDDVIFPHTKMSLWSERTSFSTLLTTML